MKNGSFALHSEVVATRQQISCDLEGEAVILHLGEGVYYGLNEVGAKVWTLVQTPRTVLEIRDALLKDYDVEPDDCTSDLIELLQRLMDWKLVELRNGKSPGHS
jgi:hypothetical protein